MDTTAPLAGPLLTPAEEVELALDIEAGLLAADALARDLRPHDATGEELRWLVAAGERARRRYVEANLRLVAMVARQAGQRAGLTDADLFQEGCLGLMIAVDRYDYRRGCRFATYALLWIRAFIGAASARQLGTLNLPVSRAAQLRHARGIEAVLAQELGRQPTVGEVGEALGRSRDWTSRLMTHEQPQGLDEVGDIAAVDTELEKVLGGVDAPVDLMTLLEGFERRVLELRLGFVGDPLSYAEVSRFLGVTSNRVRRAERRALERLRAVCPRGEWDRLAG
ncbi:MAG TPA: sigma-70 family RNA polymerase sigma factor [Microlunatus sp.]